MHARTGLPFGLSFTHPNVLCPPGRARHGDSDPSTPCKWVSPRPACRGSLAWPFKTSKGPSSATLRASARGTRKHEREVRCKVRTLGAPARSEGTAVGSSSEIWRTFCESHVEATILTPDEKIWLAEIGSRKAFQEVPGAWSVCGNAFDPNRWSSCRSYFPQCRACLSPAPPARHEKYTVPTFLRRRSGEPSVHNSR